MTVLLDGNVLIAMSDRHHVHHDAAGHWYAARQDRSFATCPVTQGTLLRYFLRAGTADDINETLLLLKDITTMPDHQFWPDDIAYTNCEWRGVMGHRQVTDAYLAGLARHHGGRLATLDRGLASLHEDVTELISV